MGQNEECLLQVTPKSTSGYNTSESVFNNEYNQNCLQQHPALVPLLCAAFIQA